MRLQKQVQRQSSDSSNTSPQGGKTFLMQSHGMLVPLQDKVSADKPPEASSSKDQETKQCHVCDKRFFSKSDLRTHILSQHQTNDHDMDDCVNCVTQALRAAHKR